jgi:hypothetical protein
MALTSTTARQLCTPAELKLFTESLTRNVKQLDVRGLKSRVNRARKLRDKYRQRADRQDREARGKQQPRGKRAAQSSGHTRKKEQLFGEVMDRFSRQLARSEAQPAKDAAARKTTRKKKRTESKPPSATAGRARKKVVTKVARAKRSKTSAAATPGATKKASRKTAAPTGSPRSNLPPSTKKARAAAEARRSARAGAKRIQTHVAARNRRQQARRDAR